MYKVGFIGNGMHVPEYIFYDQDMFLKFVISEDKKVTDDLITFCQVRKIKHFLINKAKELATLLHNKNIDFYLMHDFGLIIPEKILKKVNIYNIHLSYLPYYKGRHPHYWATLGNEKNIGISLHKAETKIDSGEIIFQKKIPYYLWISAKEAEKKLINKTPELLCELKEYLNGKRKSKPNLKGNYYKPVTDKEIEISLKDDTPDKIFNIVRSQTSYKGAKLVLGSNIFWIKAMSFTRPYQKKLKIGEKYYNEDNNLCLYYRKNLAIKLIKYEIE